MQMLSVIPKALDALKASNDYGAELVKRHPSRFGLLAALPTNDPQACLAEIKRPKTELHADGFAAMCPVQ
jgi:6-methylsalicylate decarboxylase